MPRIVRALRIVSAACLLFMVLLTGVDVVLRSSLDILIYGTVEMIELALVALVFLALPETLWRDEQITVDLVDQLMPAAIIRLARLAAQIMTTLLLAFMTWRMAVAAFDTLRFGDTTTDLQIPMIWHWTPMILGVAAATAAAVAVALRYGRAGDRA